MGDDQVCLTERRWGHSEDTLGVSRARISQTYSTRGLQGPFRCSRLHTGWRHEAGVAVRWHLSPWVSVTSPGEARECTCPTVPKTCLCHCPSKAGDCRHGNQGRLPEQSDGPRHLCTSDSILLLAGDSRDEGTSASNGFSSLSLQTGKLRLQG
jgi:hypothetical protein